MIITIKRSGGITGIPLTKSLDTSTLPQEKDQYMTSLLTTTNFFALPEELHSYPHPDEFTYTISIIQDSQQHTIIRNEKSIESNLQTLIGFVWK